jgi:hypothetical protein
MRIEVNYQGKVNPEVEKKIETAMEKIGAKRFSRGFRGDEVYVWFDYREANGGHRE